VEVRESELTIATELRVAAAAAGELSAVAAANGEGGALRLAYLVLVKATESFALERDLASLFGKILDYVFEIIPAHRGVIFTRDEEAGEFHPVAEKVRGASPADGIVVSRTLLKRAADEAKAILTADAPHDRRFRGSQSISLHGIRSAMCVPMLHDGELQGILYLDTVGRVEKFDTQGLQLLAAISAPAAIAVKNARYLTELDRRAEQLRKSYYDTLKVVVDSLEVRDYYTIGHGRRVALFSRIIAEEMGWDEEKLKLVEMGGILHDLGKIGIEDAILRKPGALTEEEMEQMQFHPEIGARIVRDADFLKPILPYILYHQERFDGSGHPYHLKGEEIPIEGRLMAVADAFDAMTSDRPYRKAMDAEQAISVIKEGSGQQFDPQVVQAFLEAWQAGGITKAMLSSAQEVKTVECPFCSSEIEVRPDSPDPYLIRCPTCHKRARL
jgi:HD-GYP domain-containing protein (c-di-GMP phosphodiesterase class II)